jgi:hypothetical protein
MDTLDSIAESTIASTAVPVNLTEARSKLAALRADCEAQELAIAEGELEPAEAAHKDLYAQCVAAQEALDKVHSEVEAQTHLAYRAGDRRSSAASMLGIHRRNTPDKQQPFGVAQRYGSTSFEAWNTQLAGYEAEQAAAETEYGEVFGKLLTLQGERRLASKVLEDLSWAEGRARSRAEEARRNLDALKPMAEAPDWRTPQMNGTTITFTSDNSVRSDPRTRVAATRGPGDPV